VDLVNGNGNRTLDLHGSAGLTRSAGSSGTQSLSFKNLDLQTDTTFEIGGTGRLVVASTIRDGGGSRALARTGAGTLVLSGDNTFSGGLSLSSGLTLLGHDNGAGAGTLTFAGGALGGGDAARTVANPLEASGTVILSGDQDLTLTGAFSLGTGDRTLQVENSALTTISGVISNNSSATTTKTGSGTLVLAGAAANTFAGSVAVAAGTLELAKSSGTAALAGDADVTGEGTLRLGADHQMVDTATVTLGAGTAPTFAVAGRTETIGHLVSANPTSVVDLGGGALTVGANDASGTLAGSIAGSGTFVKAGTGTLALTGSFTGAASATVSAGTLLAGADAILGAANALTVAAGATFDLASYSAAVATLAGPGTLQLGSGAVLAVGAGGDSSTFGGQLAGSGRLDKLGTGSLTFTADFSFAGELRLGDGTVVLSGVDLAVGTLRVTGNTVLDFGSSAASTLTATHVTIDPGATLTIVNWIDLQDFFFATGSFQQFGGPSAAFDTRKTSWCSPVGVPTTPAGSPGTARFRPRPSPPPPARFSPPPPSPSSPGAAGGVPRRRERTVRPCRCRRPGSPALSASRDRGCCGRRTQKPVAACRHGSARNRAS
jgi:autotransporter-associated beta strand protein